MKLVVLLGSVEREYRCVVDIQRPLVDCVLRRAGQIFIIILEVYLG
jgi:hypothetical protein